MQTNALRHANLRAWPFFRRPDQVDPMVDAAELELTDDDVQSITGGN